MDPNIRLECEGAVLQNCMNESKQKKREIIFNIVKLFGICLAKHAGHINGLLDCLRGSNLNLLKILIVNVSVLWAGHVGQISLSPPFLITFNGHTCGP